MKSIALCVRFLCSICVNFALLLFLTLPTQAHDPGLSTATVTVEDQKIEVLLGFAKQDAMFILPATANSTEIGTPEGFQAVRVELEPSLRAGSASILERSVLYPLKRPPD
jgi:hypothetical protein